MPPLRHSAEHRYAQIRQRAREIATEVLEAMELDLPEDLATSNINEEALQACAAWQERLAAWDWRGVTKQFRRDHPDRFELAIWVGDRLCGLAAGYPSGSHLHCAVVYLEAEPQDDHPLKGLVLVIATTPLETYARALGKREARLVDPNDKVVELSAELGYDFIKAPKGQDDYCVKLVTDEIQ